MRIMVVEDNENSRVLQENALEASGYEVDSAENGKLALEMIRKTPPDLIITDILMPEMDGYALCREVKNDESLSRIPIIVYTATYTDPEDEKLALDMGADRFILKPMEIPLFLKEIEKVLRKYEDRSQATITAPKKKKEKLEQAHTQILEKKLSKKIRDLEKEHERLLTSKKRYRDLVEELRAAQRSLQRAQAIAHIGNWEWNIPENSLYWSEEVYRIFGVSPDKFTPSIESFFNCVHPEDRTYVRHSFEQARTGKEPLRLDHRILLPDAAEKVVNEQAEVIFDESGKKTIRMFGTIQDITQRKQMEEEKVELETKLRQAHKMEAIGTLAGGIAHDFNNILTPILGYAEISLRSLPETSTHHRHTLKIIQAANRAKELVGQILTFSRKTDQEKKPVQIRFIIKEALKLIRPSIPSTIDIRQQVEEDCGAVLADPTQIHQIIINLCTNAYQAMRKNGGTLYVNLSTVRLGPLDAITQLGLKPGMYNRLELRDTGCGMDGATIERIFDPYFTTKEKGEGTGLGLSVVHGIVTRHGGYITVHSEPGTGTAIYVYLPEIETEVETETTAPVCMKLEGGNERIMVVDDEPDITQLEELFLSKLGYQVVTFASGMSALEALRQDPLAVDLLITDMTMPKMTGADLAEKVSTIRADLPVILCSGFSEAIDRKKVAKLGIRRFLIKPLIMSELAETVRQVLDQKKTIN